MASFSTDTIESEIRKSVLVVQDRSKATKEKEEQAELTVYRALSIHPALANMHPPTGEFGDLDWYSELWHPLAFSQGIFKTIGQNEHFQRASLLGETGRRVGIMLLLCWVIGHRLSVDCINRLVSTTVEDALNEVFSDPTDVQDLTQLLDVRKVLESITRMIRTHLPLPPDRNPFYGEDFSSEDEDKPIPHSELWAYSLSEDQRYEFDIKSHPSVLLRSHPVRVLIPTTKLSLFAIQWTSWIFGLGKSVLAAGDIDSTAFWNADPPAPNAEMGTDSEDIGSISGLEEVDDDLGSGDLSDAWEDLPLDDWIHERFCYVYPVHGWVHDRFTRILLFSTFCHCQCLPSKEDVFSALNVSRTLRRRLGPEVCSLIEPFLILGGFNQWDSATDSSWIPSFSVMSKEERAMSAIFVDAYRFQLNADNQVPDISDFNETTSFLIHPEMDCPGQPDILDIPILRRFTNEPKFPVPEPDLATCSCRQCPMIQESVVRNFENFQAKYFMLGLDRYEMETRGALEMETRCDALEKAWDPLFTDVESWVDSLVGMIEIAFDLFPHLPERRLGPSILYVLHLLEYEINSHLDTKQLLRFFSLLRYSHLYPDAILLSLPELEGDVFAFLADDEPDRGEEFDSPLDENTEIVLSSAGGWLYDAVSGNGFHDQNAQISFLHSSTALSIRVHPPLDIGIIAIGMPEHKAVAPALWPHAHELLDAPESTRTMAPSEATGQIVFDIGPRGNHGFPPLPGATDSNSAVFGAQISTTYAGRVIRTFWRPEVRFGRPCQHARMYNRMSRCSLTSHEILLQVRPTSASIQATLLPTAPCTTHAQSNRCKEHNDLYFEEHKWSTRHLTERGGPFEHSKYCIVRCGDVEGPADPIILLAGSLGRRVYIFHHRECWACACHNMRSQDLSLGIVFGTKVITKCAHCLVDDKRAHRIANQIEHEIEWDRA